MIHDNRICELGEGPLWHPTRNQLFWFDILGQKLLSRDRDGERTWKFPENVSAAGWVSDDVLLIAGERDLFLFDLVTEEVEPLCELEADKPGNRPNDGRADRQGGFWIGTMAKGGDLTEKGAIYRFYKGEMRLLYPKCTIPNSICFSVDGAFAHFTGTLNNRVMKVALDTQGWPKGEPEVFLDLRGKSEPDGAVIDADGVLWLAEWGAGRVAAYAPDGKFLRAVSFDGPHTSCPAFGGPDMTMLYCTTALEGMSPAARAQYPDAGKTFAMDDVARGLPEPRVLL
ncbi:MAG: SMP-30/gluconolactonase/LRE family protein [Paracoccaceae bacterium]